MCIPEILADPDGDLKATFQYYSGETESKMLSTQSPN